MTRKKPMRRRPAEWVGAARRNRRSRGNLPFVGLRLGPWEMPTLACACSNEATWFCPGGWHGRLAEDGSQISVVVAVVAICALFFGLLLLSVPYFSFYLLPLSGVRGPPVQQRSSRIYFAVGYR